MKTEAIKVEIIENYKQLSQLAHVKPEKENIVPTWGLVYKHNGTSGFVNQIGVIERNRASIRIVNENELQLQKKPFYLTWKRTLKNINSMLKKTIENINNSEIVTKRVTNILCFPKDTVERLAKIARH
ncbi:MAG: hypothetical protein MJ230_02845 [bacterium]|nr:hypothetical protein [bacterium]